MPAPQTIWGIDIGRSALKAVRLRAAGDGKVELLAHDYIEHAKILSQPDADRDELISNALEKFLSRNDLSKDSVVVSVPGQHTLARFTKLPPVAPKKVPDIVRYEADQQIPFDMDEVIWDYQTFKKEDLPDIEVGIFAMKRELIREHLLHYEQASIEPILVQSGPLAIYNAAHFDGMLSEDTTIILDIGAENTDLIIATPESLWTRTIGVAGNTFTEALVKSFKLSFSKAENLKRTASSSKYSRQVFQAMRPIFADLVQELQRSIGFYSSTHREAEITKVIGLGNALKLPGLQKYLQQNLGLPVEKPEKFNKIADSSAASAPQFTDQLLSFAIPYGLAIQGLELGQVTTNLLPTELAKQVVWRRKKPTFAAAAACLLIAGGLIWFRQSADMSALASGGAGADRVSVSADKAVDIIERGPSGEESPLQAAKQVLQAGQALKRQLGQLAGEGDAEKQQAEELIEMQQNKAIIPRILHLVHDSVPQDAQAPAATDAEIRKALTEDATPRAERRQVFIRKFNIEWLADVSVMSDWDFNKIEAAAQDVVREVGDEEEEGVPGFFLRIFCETPNEGGSEFVYETFMKNLKEMGRQPGQPFYVNRVYLVDGQQVGAEEGGGESGLFSRRASRGTRSRDRESVYTRGPRSRSYGTGRETGSSEESEAVEFDQAEADMLDPLTGESIASDWRFEIVAEVFLENLPESATSDDSGGSADDEMDYDDEDER
ncbi:MAG: type IV pilus assembly protein PilM [Phycisphaerales bacterium]|nr:MAG: type IV pilus assembly protein PilM [Phycisphaerales bacterium]